MRDKEEEFSGLVAVAIDRDKASQNALKWTLENLLSKRQTVILIHVKKAFPNQISDGNHEEDAPNVKDIFLPFRCFCTRKEIHCKDVMIEDSDISKAIIEYISQNAVEKIVLGASSRNVLVRRIKGADVPTLVQKGSPDFCNVYVISRGKVSSLRSASRPAPAPSPLRSHTYSLKPPASREHISYEERNKNNEHEGLKSPLPTNRSRYPNKSYGELDLEETNILPVNFGRSSCDSAVPSLFDHSESSRGSTPSNTSIRCISHHQFYDSRSTDTATNDNYSTYSHESSWSSQSTDEMEAEMRRLRLELKQTMELYSSACREALTAKQKARELHRWKLNEEHRLEEARMAEEAALAIAEKEKAKSKAAIEAADAARRIAELEAQKRKIAETKALHEAEERKKAMSSLAYSDARYRKYNIEEIEEATGFFSERLKIGEGGYGPVYKCFLDHTPVAIKVLRPDAAQGRSQFQQEVEVLSCIRHPNMVLLLGACPEYGCLVYEYMGNGSLDDCLFQQGNAQGLSWQLRFRIAAEISTGLLFLHQTRPEPLVHRDLKPGNILLDRNYVSKISDVGLARLVPPSVADTVTQYLMTSTAGTFCYIDPEYQQTGMLGVKSDVYSLGIILLQLITGRQPMGLTHHVERAIEKGKFEEMLDPQVHDWPVEEALKFAKLALQCSQLRRKDRPDLGKVVLPELNRLRMLAEEHMPHFFMGSSGAPSPNYSYASFHQEVLSEAPLSSYDSRSSASSLTGRQ